MLSTGVVDEVPPVDRLTCLLSALANAASTSRAGTAVADMTAKRRKDEIERRRIVKFVYGVARWSV